MQPPNSWFSCKCTSSSQRLVLKSDAFGALQMYLIDSGLVRQGINFQNYYQMNLFNSNGCVVVSNQ